MRVRIDRLIEDSNIFEDIEDPLTQPQEFTIGHRVKVIENKPFIRRVDRISRAHGIVDLPEKQAKNLIELGYAHEPNEQDENDNKRIRKLLELDARATLKRLGLT